MSEEKMEEKKTVVRGPRSKQKLKILYLLKILMERTDDTHDITLQEIVDELKTYDVTAERKSIYSDIENLRDFGYDIVGSQYDRTYHYQLINRDFELAELKLLVDSVQSARFITEKKSNELIKKIEGFASKHEALKLHRQVNVNGRVKSQNTAVYYNVDSVHEAISSDRQIEFQYFQWNVHKKMEPRHDGMIYKVSPWAMCWDDEKYYLLGYDEKDEKIKYFRVDKMTKTEIIDKKRNGKATFNKINMQEITNRQFGMYEGDERSVELLCDNSMANVIIDRFGMDVPIMKADEEHFKAVVRVAVSPMFFGWIMALQGVKIVAPLDVVDKMKDHVKRLCDVYNA